MVFGAGPGYGGTGLLTGYPTEPAYSGHEPFLQRWLFSKRLGLIAIGAAAVIAACAGAWWLTSGQYTPLPSVAGQPAAKAEAILRSDGFRAQEGTLMVDNSVPKGEVISTSPSGRAPGGAMITLTVSSGPRMISVPSVSGQPSVAAAEAVLRNAGLTVSATPNKVAVNGEPVGTVVGTTPAAGTLWPQTRAVYVDVAAGIPLPPLVGQNVSAIQQWAGQNNIQLNTVNVPSSQPSGIIVSQSPAAGSPVAPGQTVTVHVSSGPPMVTIPDVRGERFGQAKHQLENLGFQVTGQQIGFGNTVFSTSPSGSAQQGSTITVYYGGFGLGGL
jgi:eukaryotic-like serine/threonine-protein kinase